MHKTANVFNDYQCTDSSPTITQSTVHYSVSQKNVPTLKRHSSKL